MAGPTNNVTVLSLVDSGSTHNRYALWVVSRLRADIVATIDELAKRNAGAKIGLTGFCFGGTVVWDFVTVGDARLAAAGHGFYSQVDSEQSKAAYSDVLSWYERYLK